MRCCERGCLSQSVLTLPSRVADLSVRAKKKKSSADKNLVARSHNSPPIYKRDHFNLVKGVIIVVGRISHYDIHIAAFRQLSH